MFICGAGRYSMAVMIQDSFYTITHRGSIVVIEFVPETKLAAEVMDTLQPVLLALVESEEPVKVVVDCANVKYLSSLAIGTLLTMQLKAERRGSRVVIANTSAGLKEILETVKIADRFEIADCCEDALRLLED